MARGKARTTEERIISAALLKAKNKVLELQKEYEELLEEQRLEKANQILELSNRTGLSTDEIEEIVKNYVNENPPSVLEQTE